MEVAGGSRIWPVEVVGEALGGTGDPRMRLALDEVVSGSHGVSIHPCDEESTMPPVPVHLCEEIRQAEADTVPSATVTDSRSSAA